MKMLKTTIFLLVLIISSPLFSTELILNSDSSFTPTHENRFALMFGFKPSLLTPTDMSNFTFSYSKKWDDFWLDANFMMTKGLFRKFSANNPSATGATDAQLEDQKNSLTTFGLGIGRETRYAQTLLPINDLYEMMSANITYNSYKEDFMGKSFSGPGLLAKFSVYKKFNDYFSLGTYFNYNLAVVKRAKEDSALIEENSSVRSLTIGFLTVGVDFSFYL